MNKKLIAIPVVAAALGIGLTACNAKPSTPTSSASAQAEKATAEQYMSKCVPTSSLGQIQLAEGLTNPANRAKLSACLGIPADQKQAFGAAAIGDAENVTWSSHSARTQYFTVTLPGLAEHYRGLN